MRNVDDRNPVDELSEYEENKPEYDMRTPMTVYPDFNSAL